MKSFTKDKMPCGSGKDNSKSGENGHCGFQDLDHSVLQHSLTLGVNNVKQILMSVKNGTREVKDILLNECNVIYECKVCANLFRSLANFLYHKRCYCKKHLCEDMQLFDNFEESTSTVVVHPEAPDETPLPQMRECTVELEKADVVKEKSLLAAQGSGKEVVPKEKPGRKSGRGREHVEEDGKKSKASGKESKSRSNSPVPEDIEENGKRSRSEKASGGKELIKPRSESPMISRRTREKNKRVAKTRISVEPPKKAAKVSKSDSTKSSDSDDSAKGNADNSKNKANNVKGNSVAVKGNSQGAKLNGKTCIKSKNGMQNNSEGAKCTSIAKTSTNLKSTSPTETSAGSSNLDDSRKDEDPIEILTDENNDELVETSNTKITSLINVKEEDANKAGESSTNNCPSSSKMLLKPVKKIILANPKTLDLKNGSVFQSIQNKIKANKIGFTKITNSSGKNLQGYPKIIFKTLDGNPHAVFQATEGDKSDNMPVKSKPEVAVAPSQPDEEKTVFLTEKDAASSSETTEKTTQPLSPPSMEKVSRLRTEFHVTRRKRLLSRSDCNVADLKCLNCRTSFTSIKTLYFHMLSIHSKKRLYYPCPFCRQFFVQMYGVTRHLVSIHNKSKEQINKLREVIKKKSIWKKVDDTSYSPKEDDKPRPRSTPFKEVKVEAEVVPEPEIEVVPEPSTSIIETPIQKTPPKSPTCKSSGLHQCSKCNRAFERKSSQVSHEKFCIMNAIKVEIVDLAGNSPISPPPNVSFLSLSPRAASVEPQFQRTIKSEPSDSKSNTRPKRGAEKQMHKDFVNSQTLKWRSANRVDTKAMPGAKKGPLKNLEKKVLNIMNVDNLLCTKCDKTFSSYSNLRRHVAIHVGWTRFKCKFCEYQAYNKSQCWAHLQKAHGVPDEELDKGVENLSNTPTKKGLSNVLNPKQLFEVRPKQMSVRTFQMSKTKIGKKKKAVKKQAAKKATTEDPKKEKVQPEKKMILDEKKDKTTTLEKSKGSQEVKKGQINEGKKKEKSPTVEITEIRKEKCQMAETKSLKEKESLNKMEVVELGKEKNSFPSIIKYNVPGVRKDGSNYKSVTTNSPTTIILSKKLPAPTTTTVQSILTLTPESVSSNASVKTLFPLRSSPRKVESKSPEEKSLTSLVTRSGTYTKSNLPPLRSNSVEEQKKPIPVFPDKTYAKKDRLISEWFPKKDLNSNSSRRESAPLIIGLVPASSDGLSARAKNPAISYERSNCR